MRQMIQTAEWAPLFCGIFMRRSRSVSPLTKTKSRAKAVTENGALLPELFEQ